MNIIDCHFFHALAFIRRSKISFHRRGLFVFRRDSCFSIPQCQCGSSACKPSSICSNTSTGISVYIYINRWKHACKFSAIHVKNTYQICNCFLHECLASFLKQDGVEFRQWSAITRKLSYPLWSDGNRTLSFHFSGLWLAPKTFYCYLNKLNFCWDNVEHVR